MSQKDNQNKNKELSTEQNVNMIDGIIDNLPPTPVSDPQDRPLDRVKPPTEKKRSRERER